MRYQLDCKVVVVVPKIPLCLFSKPMRIWNAINLQLQRLVEEKLERDNSVTLLEVLEIRFLY